MDSVRNVTVGDFLENIKIHTLDTFSDINKNQKPLNITNTFKIISQSQERLFYIGIFLMIVSIVFLCVVT